MDAHEVLVRARNLIDDPKDWCGDAGSSVTRGPRCAVHAIIHAYVGPGAVSRPSVLDESLRGFGDVIGNDGAAVPPIVRWNDDTRRTHAEVIAAFDKAIAATAPEPNLNLVTRDPVAA